MLDDVAAAAELEGVPESERNQDLQEDNFDEGDFVASADSAAVADADGLALPFTAPAETCLASLADVRSAMGDVTPVRSKRAEAMSTCSPSCTLVLDDDIEGRGSLLAGGGEREERFDERVLMLRLLL